MSNQFLHIVQKEKIAPKIPAKIGALNRRYEMIVTVAHLIFAGKGSSSESKESKESYDWHTSVE